MSVILVVMACVGPLCAYSSPREPFASLAQCERLAPFVAGMTRANLTSMMGYVRHGENRTRFSCVDPASGAVLLSYDSRPQMTARRN
jgi:hypothetical protein